MNPSKYLPRFFAALNRLQLALFACYSETSGNSKEIALARYRLYCIVKKIRDAFKEQDLSGIECLYETVFLLGQLRFRVRDRALFEVCRQELTALSHSLSGVLKTSSGPVFKRALADFDRVTDDFQKLYDSVLYITAREPQVFEFLFAHLALFRTALLKLREAAFASDH